jgi:HPt (histidine-containing phosphotransfer) domain-containing protein
MPGMSALASGTCTTEDSAADTLLDRQCIEEIRYIERATGRNDVLAGFIRTLESNLAGFRAAFSDCIARGDTKGATRAAHTLKGTCRQLGARALGDLFADIESRARTGDYAGAKRRFDGGVGLIVQSLQALKRA